MADGRLSYLKPGQKLGKYEIKGVIGRGGMAEVYRALNPGLNQDVAIKVLHPSVTESKNAIARFQREAQSIAGLIHPHIVRVYDFENADEIYYMVMELVDGGSLKDLMAKFPNGMPEATAIGLFKPILSAVAYAHERGVTHRDIKPANVLLSKEQRPILTDFGLALMTGGERLTQTGMGAGTPAYMSPEQVSGNEITPASDVYSLAVMLYEMLSGDVPFKADTYTALMLKHLQEMPRPITERVKGISPAINFVILRALSKDPQSRFRTAAEMLNALADVDETAIQQAMTTLYTEQRKAMEGATVQGLSTPSATQLPMSTRLVDTVSNPASSSSSSRLLTQTAQTLQRNPVLVSGILIAVVLGVIGLGIVGAIQGIFRSTETSTPVAVATAPVVPPGMVYIPGGTFLMGTSNGRENEKPPHSVTISPYYIDKTEVTNRSYLEFVTDNPRPSPLSWPKTNRGNWILEVTEGGLAIGKPLDRMSYDGKTTLSLTNTNVRVVVDPDNDTGEITVSFSAENLPFRKQEARSGKWTFTANTFVKTQPFYQGGVAENVRMHGNSGQEGPIYPTIVSPVAAWGTGDLKREGAFITDSRGEPESEGISFHMMYMDGVRTTDHSIHKAKDECCYNPSQPSAGYIDPTKKQLVLLIFSDPNTYKGGNNQDTIWLELHFDLPKVVNRPAGGTTPYVSGTGDHPVSGVTWNDAVAYCEYRKGRLPTEAEWEFAARGTTGNPYPWGIDRMKGGKIPANIANGAPERAGLYPEGASPFGLLDVGGNVWEWTKDWYGEKYYSESAGLINPVGAVSGEFRVLRGGGYTLRDNAGGDEFRTTYRLPFQPDQTDLAFGFRCVRDIG
jgi:serine/threonine-protein kinase